MSAILIETMYIVIGLLLLINGLFTFVKKRDVLSSIFWVIVGLIFIIGKKIPAHYTGFAIVILAVLTLLKRVKKHSFGEADDTQRTQASMRIGNKIFFPAILIALVGFLVAQFTKLGGLVGLGAGALSAFIVAFLTTRTKPRFILSDSSTLLQQMGPVLLLPQLLGSLGSIFAKAGIGTIISTQLASLIPVGNPFLGVLLYCLGMAIFTVIMGNAFAAFALITAGIGFPFVLNLGANPVVVSALGLSAGYCGTLITPMAANFNILPASILQMDKPSRIITTQMPLALILLTLHIILMYFWGFSDKF